MGIFSPKKTACPVCDEPVEEGGGAFARHNLRHAIPADDGGGGYMWRCGCGSYDGVWDNPVGASAGLTMHMEQQHRIRATV